MGVLFIVHPLLQNGEFCNSGFLWVEMKFLLLDIIIQKVLNVAKTWFDVKSFGKRSMAWNKE